MSINLYNLLFWYVKMSSVTLSYLINEYIRQNKTLFTIFCITILALPINEVVLPHFYGKIISALQSKQGVQGFLITIVVLIVCVQGLTIASDVIDIKLYSNMHRFITTFCLDYIIERKSVNLNDVEIGHFLARLVRFPSLLYNFIDDWRAFLVPYFVIYLFVIGYLFMFDVTLSLIILILTGVVVWFTFMVMRCCSHVSKTRDAIHNSIFEGIDEIMRNLVSILTNNYYGYEKGRLIELENRYGKVSESTLWCAYRFKIIFIIVQVIAMIIFAVRAVQLYQQKKITIANCVSILIIMLYLNNTLLKNTQLFKDIMTRYGTIQEALVLFDEGQPVINDKIKEHDEDLMGYEVPQEYCIVLDSVTFGHGKSPVISDFSLAVKCRENVAIVGEIGSGKSTLLKLLLKYHQFDGGEIYLYGVPYSRLTPEQVRDNIGYIAQSPILFNRTLFENIVYGNPNVTRDQVLAMINRLKLDDHFQRFENGLETVAGKNGSKLSGGERQIIWILRVLLRDPDIILLDEPTSAMDEKTRDTVFNMLIEIMKEKTVIAVTHDNKLLKHFDRVIEMKTNI